jgi:hypothetical protein
VKSEGDHRTLEIRKNAANAINSDSLRRNENFFKLLIRLETLKMVSIVLKEVITSDITEICIVTKTNKQTIGDLF